MSFERPPSQPPLPAEPKDPRLEKMSERVNASLTWAFNFFDRLPQEVREARQAEFEAQSDASGGYGESSPDALRMLRFQELFGPNVLESAMRAVDVEYGMDPEQSAARELNEGERDALDEYAEFLTLFDVPENRPALLAKLVRMELPPSYRLDESWPERRAFRRFLKEFYGQEKEHFLSLEGQVDLVEAWSMKGEWGFTKEEFGAVRADIPLLRDRLGVYENDPLVAPVLVPRLQDKEDVAGVNRTYDALWNLAAGGQMRNKRWDFDRSGRLVDLAPGTIHRPGLSFEVIGLGDHQGISAEDARQENEIGRLADAGVLAAAAEHPDWVEAMDGDAVPFVCAAGYVGEVGGWTGSRPMEGVPCLSFDGEKRITSDMDPASVGIPAFAVPAVRESFGS